MYCQPPLQSWGTFSLEKKGLIFLQRSTGRFSRGVSALLGRGGRAGRRAKCFGDREARSQGACGGFISAATLPPCPRCDAMRVHGRGDRAVRVAGYAWPPSGGACAGEAAAPPGSPPPGSPPAPWPGSVLSMQLDFPFCLRQKREEKNLKTASSLPSFLPLPWMAQGGT